jgi:protein arginine kinase activator
MMCNRCNKPATVHIKEISNGSVVALDLCDQCAAAAGYAPQDHLPLNEILNEFVAAHSQLAGATALRCADCGMTWQEFKDTGLLGCEKDYDIFVRNLAPVIEKAQRGAKHHTGKSRQRRGRQPGVEPALEAVQLRRTEIKRLQKELAKAVEEESYEQAAKIRDQIKTLESTA